MEESTKYLLVGGGVASVWAAQNIRERDAEGTIMLVGREHHPPYDKPPLSKQYLLKDEYVDDDAYSKYDDFYPKNQVRLRTGHAVAKIDRSNHAVTLENGDTVRYEKLLLATGATPRTLDIPGADLGGIYYLRTLEDANAIRTAMQHSKRCAIVGAGYIGLETASAAIARGLEVTVVEIATQPWPRLASPALGGFLRSYFESKGVKFLFNDEASGFSGSGTVSSLTTKSGATVAADFVVAGAGVTLNSQLAKDAGLEMGSAGEVKVNEFLQTSDPSIYAAGDIALFHDLVLDQEWHAEHHLNAKYQGRAVGAIMAGENKPYDQVPYFYSDFLDLHMILRGDSRPRQNTTILGDLNGAEFVELYADDSGALRCGIAISHEESKTDAISDKLEELVRGKAAVNSIIAESLGI